MGRVVASIHKLGRLTGHALRARDGEIGKLEEIYFDDEHWIIRYFVVRAGGWLLGREVLISPDHVIGFDPSRAELEVDLSREQVKQSPPVAQERPVSRHYEMLFAHYYDLEPYWRPGHALDLPPRLDEPVVVPGRELREPERPHLRSSDEVTGYRIHATDGSIGHVADFLVSDDSWRIRFLEVDTRSWWPSRHVLIAPAWIERVSWADHEVYVRVGREAIKTAPAYDPAVGIGPDDEIELFEHYGRDAFSR